jgi:hypothetical protein
MQTVRLGMMSLALLTFGGAYANPDPGVEAPGKSSERGLSPNASITSVSGLEIDTYRLNLMFNIPLTPTFKVADGVSYGVTTRYSSVDPAAVKPKECGNDYAQIRKVINAGSLAEVKAVMKDYKTEYQNSSGVMIIYATKIRKYGEIKESVESTL